jgi:2-polyprenyl-3-methyl-5-hydroxy-6-metoxy-1,4-benzoquinol methylase
MPEKPSAARLFHLADGLYRRAENAMRALHQGFWLGWMGTSSLNEATRLYYAGSSKYQDTEYNSSGLKAWESRLFDRHFAECRTLLVGAVGGGREAVALAERGLEVTAFECSLELARSASKIATARGLAVEVMTVAPSEVPELDATFDGIVVGLGGYMHIPGRTSRVRFLQRLRQRVEPGAPLMLSFFTRNPDSRLFMWSRRVARGIRWIRFSREAVDLGDAVAGSFDHHFTKEQIASELAGGGFELVDYGEDPIGQAVARAIPHE